MNEINLFLVETFPKLTPRQLQVFNDYSTGKTPIQMQAEAKCSRTAIEKHLSDLRLAFSCSSTSELRTIYLNNIMLKILLEVKKDKSS